MQRTAGAESNSLVTDSIPIDANFLLVVADFSGFPAPRSQLFDESLLRGA
jgi:hypothetical protein